MRSFAVAALWLGAFPDAIRADTLRLRDGSTLHGRIIRIEPGKKYVLLHADGSEIVYPATNVAAATYSAPAATTPQDEAVPVPPPPRPPKERSVVVWDQTFTIGVSTRDDVTEIFGKPQSVAMLEDGGEMITYNSGHLTGKSFAPFYFGTDTYRLKTATFTFDANGTLKSTSTYSNK